MHLALPVHRDELNLSKFLLCVLMCECVCKLWKMLWDVLGPSMDLSTVSLSLPAGLMHSAWEYSALCVKPICLPKCSEKAQTLSRPFVLLVFVSVHTCYKFTHEHTYKTVHSWTCDCSLWTTHRTLPKSNFQHTCSYMNVLFKEAIEAETGFTLKNLFVVFFHF